MSFYRFMIRHRLIITIVPAVAGILTMAYYASCKTACSYLRGDILGIDLKYIGVVYMAAIIILSLLKQSDLLRMLVAAGIGVEVFLISFQVSENVFCPFCLTFGIMVFLMYLINYERSSMHNRKHHKFIYAFGDAKIPLANRPRIPLILLMIVGYIFTLFSFSGSATPVYAADIASAPSYGKGSWELIIFTDYFCPPCQSIESELEPEVERLMARGDVKITFVDFPGHRKSTLYSKYFLASVAADSGYSNALKARRLLFSMAQENKVDQENVLAATLKSKKVMLKIIDPVPVFHQWSAMIKRYEITQTPTCLLRFSSAYTKKYSDAEQIHRELIPELRKRFPQSNVKIDG